MNTILEYAKRNKSSFEMGGVSSDEDASVFEFVEGTAWDNDFFPKGKKNAYTLGQFIGYNSWI